MKELRFRQVHLDFHTSGLIDNIGSEFDPETFAKTLSEAHINSITCFGRCHHGYLYYNSEKFPELIHPNLKHLALLEDQISACHANDIRVPVYTTVQWDELQTRLHPEWLMRTPEGKPVNHGYYEAGFYNCLCVNTPYLEFLKDQVADMITCVPDMDGIFLDIVQERECSCKYCQKGMKQEGLNPHNEKERKDYGRKIINDFKHDMTCFIHSFNPELTIFYNCQAVQQHSKSAYTHIEVESLPSGAWGYDHFAFESRYVRNLGPDIVGQTGKFHTAWGDFHSFKTKEALEYECFRMIAMGAKCMIGDQLEPNGALSPPVYNLIGSVYVQIEEREPWCTAAKAVTDIAIFDPREFYDPCQFNHPEALLGAMKMLEQVGGQFDIIDSSMGFSMYNLLVLPDVIPVEGEFGKTLDSFINNGGNIILSYLSGFSESKRDAGFVNMPVVANQEQMVNVFGEEFHGKFDQQRNSGANYLLPNKTIGAGLPETEHVMYMKNLEVTPASDCEVLATVIAPCFYRDYRHFCSHRQAPSSGIEEGAGIIQRGKVIYFAHNIFTLYQLRAPKWIKVLFNNAVNLLITPMLRHNGPTTLLAALNRQEAEKRDVLHLLHYIPKRVSSTMDIIEDRIPLYQISFTIGSGIPIDKILLVPQGKELPFSSEEGRINFTVEKIDGHQMVELQWGEIQ